MTWPYVVTIPGKENEMSLNAKFGDIAIGKDTSGNFKPSFEGLAVLDTDRKVLRGC